MNTAPDNTETATIVEIPDVVAPVLSEYQYDIVPTYKMIDDSDDQDALFRIQFLQAFGITDHEYHPEIVSAIIDDLYDRYKENEGIREMIESHPLYHAPDADADADADADDSSPSLRAHHCSDEGDNAEMIFLMMFSFHLFDLFHKCLRHAKHGEEIPKTLRDEIKECIRTLF